MQRLSDNKLATLFGVLLFVLAGWPLFVVPYLPYEDLGGHLGTITILRHPAEYPEFVPTGIFKTNAAIYAFGVATKGLLSEERAMRVFCIFTLLANAMVLPHFVLRMRSRAAMLTAMPFLPPFVHHWFFSMGMMNFALALPMTLVLIVLLRDQEKAPGWKRAVGIVALTSVCWFCHSFPLLEILLLVAVRVLTASSMQARIARFRVLVPPLVPVTGLVFATMASHMLVKSQPMGSPHDDSYSSVPWLLYDVWAHYLYVFSEVTATSLVLGLALMFLALRRAKLDLGLLSWPGWVLLVALYAFTPSVAFDWAFLGTRFLPYIWFAALLRVPEQLPRWAYRGAVALAALFVVGLNIDVIKASQDHAEIVSGTSAVPQGAKLLPLMFRTRKWAKNTWSLDSTSGYYVYLKHTTAFDVWATNNSMPIVRKSLPHPRFDRCVLRRFLLTDTVSSFCADEKRRGLPNSQETCKANYAAAWAGLWADVNTEYTHVLMFAPPEDVLRTVPANYKQIFQNGDLRIFERTAVSP
jgi:hypothetical protein